MNKGISFYWGYKNLSPEEKVKLLKDVGFDCVITNADKRYNHQNGSIQEQVKLFKKYNIKLSSLHMHYKRNQLADIWRRGIKGYTFCRRLIKDIKTAYKYGFTCVVVHITGEPCQRGFKRLKKVLKKCEKYNIPLAIENLTNKNCFVAIFEKIKHPYLKFCYDIGHNNAFDPEFDYLSNYGDKLICLHLHDNRGEKDDHTLNKYGTIDWQKFAKKLKDIGYKGNLDYELVMYYKKDEDNAISVAKEAIIQAKELEKLIEEA